MIGALFDPLGIRIAYTPLGVMIALIFVGFPFVVRSMTIDFLKPAVLDDVLDVVTVPSEVKGASIILLQECRHGDDLLVTARVRVAFISGGRAQRIPKALRLAMEGASKNLRLFTL